MLSLVKQKVWAALPLAVVAWLGLLFDTLLNRNPLRRVNLFSTRWLLLLSLITIFSGLLQFFRLPKEEGTNLEKRQALACHFISALAAPVALALWKWCQSVLWEAIPTSYFALVAFALCYLAVLVALVFPRGILLYLVFGVLTTVLAQVSFLLSNKLLFGQYQGIGGYWWVVSQAISWVLAVFFAFVTNRSFVFDGQKGKFKVELSRFFFARAGSGLIFEYLGLFVLINLLHLGEGLAKLLVSLAVIVVNYIASKLFVFADHQGS